MRFNGGLGPFVICPDSGCIDRSVDFENVATHEIGHFLGLAHSEEEDATMACTAPRDELRKRSLEEDDRAGICAAYGQFAVSERKDALNTRNPPAGCGCRIGHAAEDTGARAVGSLGLLVASVAPVLLRRRGQRQIRR